MIPTELSDERIRLRAPTLDDVADLARICQDPEIPRWIGAIPLNYGEDDARWWVSEVVGPGWESGHDLVWLVTDVTTGKALGNVGLHQRSPGVAEIGYLLDVQARGQGYMTDAVNLVCEYAFSVLGIDRVEWQAVVGNAPSRAVVLRAGFAMEGTLRGRLQQHDGSGTGERVAADAWMGARLRPGLTSWIDPQAEQVVLHEEDVVLRPWQPDDVDAVFWACQDPDVQRWTLVPVPYEREHAESFVARQAQGFADGRPSFAATDAASGELLGAFGAFRDDVEAGPEVGYWLAPSARGRGVATRALRALCRYLFEQGAPRIRWEAEVGNLASLRTAEAVGFHVDGTMRLGAISRGTEERVGMWAGSLLPGELREADDPPAATSPVLRGWTVEQPVLTTARLVLRPAREEDIPVLVGNSEDEALRVWGMAPYVDEASAQTWLRNRATRWQSGVGAGWTITDAADGRILGNVVLFRVPGDEPEAEVGYGLFASARGQGYATESVEAVTRWAFQTLDLERIRLMHAVENEASCGVAMRSGYLLEGVLRQSYRYGDGRLHDEHLHARLASDPPPGGTD